MTFYETGRKRKITESTYVENVIIVKEVESCFPPQKKNKARYSYMLKSYI